MAKRSSQNRIHWCQIRSTENYTIKLHYYTFYTNKDFTKKIQVAEVFCGY